MDAKKAAVIFSLERYESTERGKGESVRATPVLGVVNKVVVMPSFFSTRLSGGGTGHS